MVSACPLCPVIWSSRSMSRRRIANVHVFCQPMALWHVRCPDVGIQHIPHRPIGVVHDREDANGTGFDAQMGPDSLCRCHAENREIQRTR